MHKDQMWRGWLAETVLKYECLPLKGSVRINTCRTFSLQSVMWPLYRLIFSTCTSKSVIKSPAFYLLSVPERVLGNMSVWSRHLLLYIQYHKCLSWLLPYLSCAFHENSTQMWMCVCVCVRNLYSVGTTITFRKDKIRKVRETSSYIYPILLIRL